MRIYSIYDVEREEYLIPFFVSDDTKALRAVAAMVNNEQSEMYLFPEQFELHYLGVMNGDGSIIPNDKLKLVKTVKQVKINLEEK